ncbi:MAG: hypothetical protein LR001_05580 [Clostridiales bacterium]|nr:hypothetical protein [Clostridiales bacterium]
MEREWNKWIEVGRCRRYMPTGGGTGTVVIDLFLDKNATHHPETFNFTVAVGSDERDGIKVIDVDYKTIEIPIPLTDNE